MEADDAPGGAEGCPADEMDDVTAFWKGAVIECMLNEPQVASCFVVDEIVVCTLVQKSGIGTLAKGMLLVPILHLWSGFDGHQCGTESPVHAYKVSLGHAVCMC